MVAVKTSVFIKPGEKSMDMQVIGALVMVLCLVGGLWLIGRLLGGNDGTDLM